MESKKFTMEVTMDNSAFVPDGGRELARILREVADSVDHAYDCVASATVRDHNGSTVGQYQIDLVDDN